MNKIILLLCLSLFLSAADDLDHVSFEGMVTDTSIHAVVGARVTLIHTGNNNERNISTDQEGRYRFANLPPGTYVLSVEADGFQGVRYEGIETITGETLHRDFKLQPASISTQITIEAGADSSLIDTTKTVVGGTITAKELEVLPVETRNPLDLIFTLPGTSPPALSDRDLAEGDQSDNYQRTPEEAGVFSLNGGTPFSNNVTIDGLDNNDDRGARERINLSASAVEEVQVITNQFSSEYGRASGGRVNLRLRGGSNQVRGEAFYYFRDESLNANSFRRNADPARGFRLPYQDHNPGASLGAPIIPNRIFFFGAYEYSNTYDRAEIAALLPVTTNPAFPLPKPTGANLGSAALNRMGLPVEVNGGSAVGLYDMEVTTPSASHTFQSRGDFKAGERNDLFAVYTLARNIDERGFPGGRRTLDTIRRLGRSSQSIAFSGTSVITASLFSSAKFQFSRLTPIDAPPNSGPVILISTDDPRDVIGQADSNPFTRSGTLTAGSSTLSGTDRREDRYQIQDTLNYLRGGHSFRLGGDFQVIRSRFVDLSDASGTFTFATPADFLANIPSRYQHRFNTGSELRNSYSGIFLQDDWRMLPNFTLAFGLRWDNESILHDRNNFGPRLSFAWDPFKTNRTVVRGGYGIFYNRAMLRTLDDFLLTSNAVTIDTNNDAAERLLAELQFPGVLAAGDTRVSQFGVRESGFLRRLSAGFRIPESYQASLGIEREIANDYKIGVTYVFSRSLHLWREINANAPRLPAGYRDFTEYLTSRDFDNTRDPVTGRRPITATGNADTVRFSLSQTPSQVVREGTRRIVVIGLNNPSTSNQSISTAGALAAIRGLRPDPSLTQVEELQARGNSFYHGLSFELQRRFVDRFFFRASYTLSKLIDDGVVNTSSPQVAGDFGRERSLSLMDARHRITFSGSYLFPAYIGGINLSGTFNLYSSRPFSIGTNGNDRNLDNVNNDRPNFTGELDEIVWRRTGEPLAESLVNEFSLPVIGGSGGNLPRNAGRGPKLYTLNLRLSREFAIRERQSAEIQVEAYNPLNATVFSFGSEFVDYTPTSLGNFLTPARTVKPRTMRVGLKVKF
jgi:carboxypeptidase family protein